MRTDAPKADLNTSLLSECIVRYTTKETATINVNFSHGQGGINIYMIWFREKSGDYLSNTRV